MNWLIFVAITVISDSLRIFVDNYASDVYFKGRHAVSAKILYGISYIIIFGPLLAITGFNFLEADGIVILFLAISGILASLAGIPYFRALELDDSTNIGIFTQISPVFYLIIGWLFLGDTFSPIQLIAFCIILAAPFLIIFTTKRRSRKVKIRAVLHAFLYILLAIIGNVFFVKADGSSVSFLHEVSIVFFFNGLTDIIAISSVRKWRRRFITVINKSHKRALIPLICNVAIRVVQQFSYRAALITAPALAIASVASDSAEPIVIFFLGILLTLIWPKFGREKLDKKTVLVHLIATVLVVVGVIILQI